jgi:hypothetical protein
MIRNRLLPRTTRRSRPVPAWAVVLGAAAIAIYVARLDHAAGLIVDDAWYVVLAKALAQGEGYRLISSGAAQILPAVPPGFPLLLAPAFALNPDFPGNVLLLKLVSVAAMLGVGALTYRYLTAVREWPQTRAAVVALTAILTPAFVFLATSTVMAECVFTLAQIAAVWLIDRAGRAQGAAVASRHALAAGLVAGGAWLVRSAGVASVIAGLVFLLWRRRHTSAALFGAAAVAVSAPWLLYAQLNAPTAEERMVHGGAMAYAYSDLLRFREGGVAQSGHASPGDIAGRIAGNLVSVFGKDTGAIVAPALYRGPGESGQEVVSIGASRVLMAGSMGNSAGTYVISLLLSTVALVGFVASLRRELTAAEILVPVSVGMIALVPSWSFRYTLTLTPFILFYLLTGIEVCLRWIRRRSAAIHADAAALAGVRIAAFTILGLHVLEHAQYVALARSPTAIEWLGDAAEADALFDWMTTHVQPGGLVASTNPGLVYLRTGQKAVASDNPSRNWRGWRAGGIRHMVALRPVELPPPTLGYEVRYVSPRRKLWVIEITPDELTLERAQPRTR